MKRCSLHPIVAREEWEALFSTLEHPYLVQSWAYGEAVRKAVDYRSRRRLSDAGGWRVRRFVFEREGQPVAICQLLGKSLAGAHFLSRLNRGPLFLHEQPDAAVVRDVYATLRARWRLPRGVLVLAPALAKSDENYRLLSDLGFRDRDKGGWRAAWLDLRLEEDELRANLASTWRNRLKKSERSGLTVKISSTADDIEWMLARHVDNTEAKGFRGHSTELLRSHYQAAPRDFHVFQGLLDGEPVGGMLVCCFGNTAEYYVGWFGQKGRQANVGNFLYWQITLEMKRRGYRYFDLGGYFSEQRYGHFKQGMRGTEYLLLNEWLAY